MNTASDNIESLESFERRARRWLERNLPTWDDEPVDSRELQHRLFDAGFAGIGFPTEYGGAGLTLQHQKLFFDLAADLRRQVPSTYLVSIGIMAPTLLDHASHELKLEHLPKILRGDELWMQLLSEPSGGSDMAGATTRLDRDGDTYILNGAKMWSSNAYRSDFGGCLCRTDWNVPKHQGLSMIMVPLSSRPEGLTVQRTRAADGQLGDFCEESFVDLRLPVGNLIGEENNGWAVAHSLLFHEHNAIGRVGHGYLGRMPSSDSSLAGVGGLDAPAMAVVASGRGTTAASSALVADVYIKQEVLTHTTERIKAGMKLGHYKGQGGSLLKLMGSTNSVSQNRTALSVTGAAGVIWDDEDELLHNPASSWLGTHGHTLGGGSSEMHRNIISERILELPREPSFDRDVPFNEVVRNRARS